LSRETYVVSRHLLGLDSDESAPRAAGGTPITLHGILHTNTGPRRG
jgi:hypothetical protein